MNVIREMPITRQLLLLSTVAVAGVVALTLFSWNRVSAVYEIGQVTFDNTLPSLGTISEAEVAATNIRVRNWQVVAMDDPTKSREARAKRDQGFTELKAALDKYKRENMAGETGEVLAEDTRLHEAAVKAMTDMEMVSKEADQLMNSGKAVEASEHLWSNLQKLQGLSGALKDLRDFNIHNARVANEAGDKMRDQMIWMLLAIGATLAVITMVFGKIIASGIRSAVDSALQVSERIAQGEIGHRIQADEFGDRNEMGRLLRALQAMDAKLCEIVGEVANSAESVGSAARQISQGNDDLSSRTQEQASALEETAATMEEMTATVKRNSDNAMQADQLGRQARLQADNSTSIVENAVQAMSEINVASRKIGDIINVIDEIAFQTNLLALNAAVEAARAGEQGRGFAVVASEVRNLAQRSASAAKEIKSLINDSLSKVNTGTELVNDSGQALNAIVNDVKRVTDIVAEIAAASHEQASGIDQINHAITQMDTTTQQNAALVEEAASASKSMEDQAQELVTRVNFFRVNGQVRHQSSVGAPKAAKRSAPVTSARAKPVAQTMSTPAPKRVVGGDSSWTEF